MNCQSIITSPPATLLKGDTVAHAVSTLQSLRFPMLPVIDSKGHYAGVFGLREVMGLLLPRAARMDDIQDLSFVGDDIGDLQSRLTSVAKDQVGRHMSPHRTVRPETSLVEAILLLYRGDAFLPVVDEGGFLVGIATAADALIRVAESKS